MDVADLVRSMLANSRPQAQSRQFQRSAEWLGDEGRRYANEPFARLFGTRTGKAAQQRIGNETQTLDAVSFLSVELLFEYMDERWGVGREAPGIGRRFMGVRGAPGEPPALVLLDPALADVTQSRLITDEVELDPEAMMAAAERLRPHLAQADPHLEGMDKELDEHWALELMAIARPEVMLTRRPRMVPLCAPAPFVEVMRDASRSSAGIFCRDERGRLGVTACLHGTGPAGTDVSVGGTPCKVELVNAVQDIVFIPLRDDYALPPVAGRAGVRNQRAPSEAETVSFDGAGSGPRNTWVKSHDAGILLRRPTRQVKVQTPADTNSGDSGAALIDADDRVVAFGFERTGIGEIPEFTDWIWADNALAALGLRPV